MEDIYDPNMTFRNNTDDEQEQEQEELLFGTPDVPPRIPSRDPPAGQRNPSIPMPTVAQMANCYVSQMMTIVQSLLSENQRLNNKSGKRSRPEKDEEEEGEPPVKLHILEGYDNAWTHKNHTARNIRPYCGDWQARFKSLGRKAKPAGDTLDWELLGTLTVTNASVRRMHDRGAILTIKMFLPMNHDVSSREAKISYKGTDGDFVRQTLNYREPT